MIIIHVLIVTFFDHGDGRLHIREKFSLMVRVIYSDNPNDELLPWDQIHEICQSKKAKKTQNKDDQPYRSDTKGNATS